MHVVDVANVGDPEQADRIVRGGELAGEAQVEIVLAPQELVRLVIDVGELVLDQEHVGDVVLAREGRDARGQPDPLDQLGQGVALQAGEARHHLLDVGCSPRIQPGEAVHQRPAAAVHRHRAGKGAGHGDGLDALHRHGAPAQQFAGGRDEGAPPLLGVLLGAAAGQEGSGASARRPNPPPRPRPRPAPPCSPTCRGRGPGRRASNRSAT